MIRRILLSTITVLAGTALVANAAPKEEVTDAAKKLGEAKNYSWKSESKSAAGGGGGQGGAGRGGFGGPTEGKVEKDGVILITMTRGENTTEAAIKGEKVAIKGQDGWQAAADAAPGDAAPAAGGGRGNIGRMFRNYKAPAAQAQDLISKTKEIKKDGDAYTGDLTEEGVKQLMAFGGRGGANAPEIASPKGTVKFWTKDGVLSKYEFNVQGKMTFNDNEREINRTTTVEIKDVGSTKVEVPEEAKKKLEA
jgi:hypothetical protein